MTEGTDIRQAAQLLQLGRRLIVLCMVCLLTFTDLSQPVLSEQDRLMLLSGMELPLENLPEPEWLDTAEDGDETMLELSGAETSLRGSFTAYSGAVQVQLAGRTEALEPPPPRLLG